MAIDNGYTDLATVKSRLDIKTNGSDDALESIITAASRTIDSLCNRRFYQVTETRYFTADCDGQIDIDDVVSISQLATDDVGNRSYTTVWTATDYDLEPYNAATKNMPFTQLMRSPLGTFGFTGVRKGVKITGTWGWPEIPAAVSEAAILMTIRLFKRKDAPYGIAGSSDLGQVQILPRVDPDVRTMLDPYRRFWIGAI